MKFSYIGGFYFIVTHARHLGFQRESTPMDLESYGILCHYANFF